MSSPQEHYVKIGSINTRYLVEGEGTPVVLIHGAGGSASGLLPLIGPLSTKNKVYAPDLPGQGRTEQFPSGSWGIPAYAKFVCDFMTEMKLESADLLGHSWGGGIALRIAMDFPSRLRKLVLISSLCLGREMLFLYRLVSIPALGEMLASLDYARDVKKYGQKVRAGLKHPELVTDEYLKILYDVEQVPSHFRTTLKILRTHTDFLGQKPSIYGPTIRHLPSLINPTLVIWGRQDDVLPIRHGELAARLLPNVRFEPIENCGHIPMFDTPDTVNRMILEFIGE